MTTKTTEGGKEVIISPEFDATFLALKRPVTSSYTDEDEYVVAGLVDISTKEGSAFREEIQNVNPKIGSVSEGKLKVNFKSSFPVDVLMLDDEEPTELQDLPHFAKGFTAKVKVILKVHRGSSKGGSVRLKTVRIVDYTIPEGADDESTRNMAAELRSMI